MSLNRLTVLQDAEREMERVIALFGEVDSELAPEVEVRRVLQMLEETCGVHQRIADACRSARERLMAVLTKPTDLRARHELFDALGELRAAIRLERIGIDTGEYPAIE